MTPNWNKIQLPVPSRQSQSKARKANWLHIYWIINAANNTNRNEFTYFGVEQLWTRTRDNSSNKVKGVFVGIRGASTGARFRLSSIFIRDCTWSPFNLIRHSFWSPHRHSIEIIYLRMNSSAYEPAVTKRYSALHSWFLMPASLTVWDWRTENGKMWPFCNQSIFFPRVRALSRWFGTRFEFPTFAQPLLSGIAISEADTSICHSRMCLNLQNRP